MGSTPPTHARKDTRKQERGRESRRALTMMGDHCFRCQVSIECAYSKSADSGQLRVVAELAREAKVGDFELKVARDLRDRQALPSTVSGARVPLRKAVSGLTRMLWLFRSRWMMRLGAPVCR